MSDSKKSKKLYLSKAESDEVQSRRGVLVYMANLINHDIQNFLIDTAFKRLNIGINTQVKVSEDAKYLEILEGGQNDK